MPELPEVETVRRGLDPAVRHKTIARVDVWSKKLRIPISKDLKLILEGKKVAETIRRGKYILIFLNDHNGFCIHLGMSGRIRVVKAGQPFSERQKHDHWQISLDDGTHIIFNDPRRFGMTFVVNRTSWQEHKAFAEMGAEPMEASFTPQDFSDILSRKKTPIKTALLDQRVVAGVGNIYACEALHDAGIDPAAPAHALTRSKAERLFVSLRHVLERAIESGGSSLRDYRQTDGSQGYFQHNFSVYGRENESCASCDCDVLKTGGVKRIVQAGRSTFYCPRKQR